MYTESSSDSGNSEQSSFRKLTKTYNLWISETFQLDVFDKNTINPNQVTPTDIGALFVPVVKYLRLIGFCPFTIRRPDNLCNLVLFEFKWKSWLTLYSLCMSGSFGVFAAYMFLNFLWICFHNDFQEVLKFQGYKVGAPQNVSRVSEFSTRLVPATFPLFSTISVFGTLAFLPKFYKVLTHWPLFQQEYCRVFSNRKDDPFIGLRNYRNGTFIIFACVGFTAIGVVLSITKNLWGGTEQLFPEAALPQFSATFTMLIMVGGHGSHFLMFRCLIEAFRQIYVGIGKWRADAERDNQPQDYYLKNVQENVKKWTQLVVFTKKLVEISSQSVALHHVCTIFINFVYLCLGVFSFLSNRLSADQNNRGYILLLFCSWGFSLLIVKAFMCEAIVEQEKLIVDELRKFEVNDCVPALFQINTLVDIIVREPAVVRFWNVLTLNKSFLFQLFGQVATYLIVLIQFDNAVVRE